MTDAILLLADGALYRGKAFGAVGETMGEVCFNTGMTGYQEVLTDPSYCHQIVTMTAPHIGNYGVNPKDIESDRIQVAGFVIREETETPSNPYATDSVGNYLKEQEIVGIQEIDTRALVRHLREHGAMNGMISSEDKDLDSLREKIKKVPQMVGLNLVGAVTTKEKYHWNEPAESSGSKEKKSTVAALDYGIKYNIMRLLTERNCDVTVFPADTTAEEIMEINPDGIFLSNGPGDPAAVKQSIKTLKELLGTRPIFGICLGHQLLAHALGAKTYKLKFGHHGINHPVKHLETGKVEITSHNHGFAVDADRLPNDIELTHINLNDNTVEGLRSTKYPAFSVQYHPEAGPGPHDSRYLFDQFVSLMQEGAQ